MHARAHLIPPGAGSRGAKAPDPSSSDRGNAEPFSQSTRAAEAFPCRPRGAAERDVLRASYVFADFELEGSRFELRKCDKRVAIQPKELRLLLYLVAHRGRVVPKAELLEALWPQETVCGGSLKRAVRGVRRALGDSGGTQARIRTVRGFGYEFVPPSAAPVLATGS